MKDETYVFISDVKEKKVTARSARHARTHCGKGGRVRLPSDNLSKKELMKMSGECKSFRLNDPMSKEEFLAMPDDLKATYIKLLRNKYGITDACLGKALGFTQQTFSRVVKKLGVDKGKGAGNYKWDKEGFYAWWHGVDKLPEPVLEEPAEDPILEEVIISEEPKVYVEDDLPFEEPDFVPVEKYRVQDMQIAEMNHRIDELLKINEELKAVHEKDMAEIACLRNECDNQRMQVRILEAQMDVVRLIFGGQNRV